MKRIEAGGARPILDSCRTERPTKELRSTFRYFSAALEQEKG
jgi:hypothetical protein